MIDVMLSKATDGMLIAEFLNRIAIKAKNNIKDVDLVIKSIQFISQHGETNDRF
jgi:hypothetical protein